MPAILKLSLVFLLVSLMPAARGQQAVSQQLSGHRPSGRGLPASQPPAQPNIMIILADDMGFSDLGAYGGEVETPHLDQLAREGLRYKQFYNAARCCPTRAALMTGLYPHQAGMGWMAAADLGTPQYAGNLNREAVTIAEVLKMAGYDAYMTGKWHLTNERKIDGKVTDNWPAHRGFDRYFGIVPGGANYFTPRVYSNDSSYKAPDDFYLTDAISDSTVKYLDEHFKRASADPFFMYVAYTAPHWPLHALQEDIARYKERYRKGWDSLRAARFRRQQAMGLFTGLEMNPRDSQVPAWEEMSPEEQEEMTMRMAIYAAQIDIMDQGIGRIIAKLKEKGQLDNTLIFFLSDNGACAEFISSGKSKVVDGTRDTFESYRIHWANMGSTPFKEYKHYTHEGGIATPLIVHWPEGIDKKLNNTFVENYGHVTDLMATCVEVAGAQYPSTYKGVAIHPMEGKSLLPHFTGKDNHRGPIYWEHEANIALRDGKWKLVAKTLQDENFDPASLELYDMEADPVERYNLARQQPGKVKELYARWMQWARRIQVFPLDTRGYGARMQAYRRQINGDFDDKLGGWTVKKAPGLVRIDTTGHLQGKNSACLTPSKNRDPEEWVMAWQFPAKKGEKFRVSFNAASEALSQMELRLLPAKGGQKAKAKPGFSGEISIKGKSNFSYDFAGLPEDGSYRLAFYLPVTQKSGKALWIDNIKLTAIQE